jgi:hypothetical protein
MVVATAGLAVAEDSITGTIAEKGEFIVLDAADGSYVLEGNDMAAEMVGKKVKVAEKRLSLLFYMGYPVPSLHVRSFELPYPNNHFWMF